MNPTKRKIPKLQKQYVQGMIHNLSLQHWSDQQIMNFLNNEKQIMISRSRVAQIRTRMERQAEKWYFELRESRYKYVSIFKERIDSLFSYQKKLHEIINSNAEKAETKIRAISELHSIEVTLFQMWKQLPNLYVTNISVNHVPVNSGNVADPQGKERGYEETQIPPIDEQDERDRFDHWTKEHRPMSQKYIMLMESRYGIRENHGLWLADSYVQCENCKRWFESQGIKSSHICITTTTHSNRWILSDNNNKDIEDEY